MSQHREESQAHLDLIEEIQVAIKNLPSTEFNYYIAVLLASIKNEKNSKKYIYLLENINSLCKEVKNFYDRQLNEQDIDPMINALNDLIKASSMKSIPHHIKRNLINVCSVVVCIITGFIGSIVGFTLGFFSKILGGFSLGLLSGLAIGGLVGVRATNKLFQSDIDIKVEFAINNLARLQNELTDRKSIQEYEEDTKDYILKTFFSEIDDNEKEEHFERFLQSNQEFEICTTSAGHIAKSLKGNLGHHALIRFKINGVKHIPIEFGDRLKTPNFVDQSETKRVVSGQKLFEMLILDRRLQESHGGTSNAIKIYDIGSDDCRTYVDKILIGTGQDPTKIGRFSKNDTTIGRKIVEPLITFFSKIKQDELHTLLENPDDEKFEITSHTFNGPITF
jgi:hypothetical protein